MQSNCKAGNRTFHLHKTAAIERTKSFNNVSCLSCESLGRKADKANPLLSPMVMNAASL